jgi:hypothetical protein
MISSLNTFHPDHSRETRAGTLLANLLTMNKPLLLLSAGALFLPLSNKAVEITFGDFSDTSNMQLNGSAGVADTADGKVLRLTPSQPNSGGSAFLLNQVQLQNQASFSSFFTFRLSNVSGIGDGDGTGADGIVFTLQPNANNVGGLGGGLGFAGIPNSFGVEFDTYNNGEISGNHVGINLNGSVNSVQAVNIGTRMNNGELWSAWIDYNGVTDLLEVRLSEDSVRPALPILSANVDLLAVLGTDLAYAGFTAGTGAGYEDQDITSWKLVDDFAPITNPISTPEGGNAAILLMLGLGGMMLINKRITANTAA